MRDHMARVRTDEEAWREFRAGVGAGTVAERLGALVAREVSAQRRRRSRAGELDAREVMDALAAARELAGDLAAITERLERLSQADKISPRPRT